MGMPFRRTSKDLAGVVLGPGALYGAITRLEERGLIEPLESDDRRRPYRISAAGRPISPRRWMRCSVWPMKVPVAWPSPTRCPSLAAVRESPAARHEHWREDDRFWTMTRSILRWYPARWRARYGDEFIAMIADDLGGRRPTLRYRFAIARSGLNERLRGAGLLGNSVSPSEQVRGGALTVLCAFALFVIPGVAFAKISEHWDQSFQRGLPGICPPSPSICWRR